MYNYSDLNLDKPFCFKRKLQGQDSSLPNEHNSSLYSYLRAHNTATQTNRHT